MSQDTPPSSVPPPLPPSRKTAPSGTDSEKEQYSLDEMMKTLREKERKKEEKGEVVIRDDGSVARKVKRRKRRAGQPEKPSPEQAKKKLLLKVVAVAVVVLTLFLVGLFLLLSHNSKGYRKDLEKTASHWTGAEVEFKGYKRLPFSMDIKAAQFDWPAASYLRELKMSRIEGSVGFTSFLGARLGSPQIGGATGKLAIGMPTASGEVGQSLEEGDFPFSFDQYYCEALDVTFGDRDKLALQGVSSSLRYIANGGFQVTIDQGTFLLDGWKPFPISSSLMRFNDGVVDLKALSLDQPQDERSLLTSNLKISGQIPLAPGEKIHLKTETGHFPLSGLIGKSLSRLFSGSVIESSGSIFYTMGEDGFDEIVMRFTADRVKISAFPFLANMTQLFPDRQLEDLEFENGLTDSAITGILRVRPEGMAIEKLEMAQKGNIRFKGGVIIAKSGKIGGKIDLWINRIFVAANPVLSNSPIMRGSEQTGYVKVSFKLGGTVSQPDDTFRSVIGMEGALPSSTDDDDDDDDLWDNFDKLEDEILPDLLRE